MNEGRGLKLTRTTEALRDILLIGALKEPSNRRVQRAKKRIQQFCADAMAFYDSFYGDDRDNLQRVLDDKGKLRDRVDQEIQLRSRLGWDDEPTRFLEPVADLLHGKP
jgi:hypothetical protein